MTENRPTQGISLHEEKREVKQFYFSFHKSVPAFMQVISGFSHLMIVCLVSAYEHCHLVVIFKAPNYTNLHLCRKDLHGKMSVIVLFFQLVGDNKQVNFILGCICGHLTIKPWKKTHHVG